MTTPAAVQFFNDHYDEAVGRLVDWLSIPSISTDPEYQGECRRAAQWLADDLTSIGLKAELRDTPGHPVVFAHTPGPSGSAGLHIIFYGHYDVQPADPIELWDSPPFEPTMVDGPHGTRIVARGAVDDKGQVMMFVEALRAWKETAGEIPCAVTCIIEGEEESGSVNLTPFLEQACDEIARTDAKENIVLVSDTGMWDINTPAITYALRGLLYLEVTLHGPGRDLHSGMYGGCVPNPINELTRILGGLHDENQRVVIPGFYDDVVELTEAERAEWAGLNLDEEAFLGEAGVTKGLGETGYTLLERQWARPTCDINGIKGGYIGEGAKTVIATHASAKVSCRLVPNQDPVKIRASFIKWMEDQLPEGCRIEIEDHGMARAVVTSRDHPAMEVARQSLAAATGNEAIMMGCGGSIPVVESFKSVLGLDSILVGFGLSDDRVHSPNEKFELTCFSMGAKSHIHLLHDLARM